MTDKERLIYATAYRSLTKVAAEISNNSEDQKRFEIIDWLIEQAEKVQELQEENKRYHETLKYYADEKHYEPYCIDGYGCDVTEDGGEIARKALEVNENE